MAERPATITALGEAGCFSITWTGLLNGDTGSAVEIVRGADKSAQIAGTFGTGGTLKIQGSNDGTNYVSLTDPQGNAIEKTAASIEQVSELTRYIRPNVTAGDATTNLSVTLILRK